MDKYNLPFLPRDTAEVNKALLLLSIDQGRDAVEHEHIPCGRGASDLPDSPESLPGNSPVTEIRIWVVTRMQTCRDPAVSKAAASEIAIPRNDVITKFELRGHWPVHSGTSPQLNIFNISLQRVQVWLV
jgi:hypothetical protein